MPLGMEVWETKKRYKELGEAKVKETSGDVPKTNCILLVV